MRYWWVNHKQTFRHEFEGHYIWSPKHKRDGSRNRFYDFLRKVVLGDVVLSYASGVVHGAGFAVSSCDARAAFSRTPRLSVRLTIICFTNCALFILRRCIDLGY
jgi:hypothetical protein